MQTFLQQLQLIIEAILDSVIICVDVSTKFSSVACNCVKVQWLESKESTLIHQPINFINSVNVAHMKENKHIEKQTWGETSTVGGETSNEWAKRPGGETSRGETSCYHHEYQLSHWVIIMNGDGWCRFWQPVQADSQPKSSGLVLGRRLVGAVLHSSNEPGELSQWFCNDDSTINIRWLDKIDQT